MARKPTEKTLRECLKIYKPATEAVLNALFQHGNGQEKKSRQDVVRRVKWLKSKKRQFGPTFFRNLHKAIIWRQKAAEKYQALEEKSENSVFTDHKIDGHAHFLELLIWTDKELSSVRQADQSEIKPVSNIFEHLKLEDCAETEDITTFRSLYQQDLLPSTTKRGTVLESDDLTATLSLLYEARELMDFAQTLCNDLHKGRIDNTTTSVTMSMIYAQLKAMWSQAALVSNKWSDLDAWVSQETWKDFGLYEYYNSFNYVVNIGPLILLYVKWLNPSERLKDVEKGLVPTSGVTAFMDCRGPQHSEKRLHKDHAFVDKLMSLGFDKELVWDVLITQTGRNSRKVGFLLTALLGLRFRRVLHKETTKPSKLIENPVVVDLYTFLENGQSSAAIAVMFGIGLLSMFSTEESSNVSGPFSAFLLRDDYKARIEYFDSMIDRTRFIPSGTSTWTLSNYVTVTPESDSWTLGLCDAEVTAEYQRFHLASLTFLQTPPSLQHWFLVIYRAFCIWNPSMMKDETTASRLKMIAVMIGQPEGGSIQDLVAGMKISMQCSPKKRVQAVEKIVADPKFSLLSLITDSKYRVRSEWIKALNGGPDLSTVDRLKLIRQGLISQGRIYSNHQSLFDASRAGLSAAPLSTRQQVTVKVLESTLKSLSPKQMQRYLTGMEQIFDLVLQVPAFSFRLWSHSVTRKCLNDRATVSLVQKASLYIDERRRIGDMQDALNKRCDLCVADRVEIGIGKYSEYQDAIQQLRKFYIEQLQGPLVNILGFETELDETEIPEIKTMHHREGCMEVGGLRIPDGLECHLTFCISGLASAKLSLI